MKIISIKALWVLLISLFCLSSGVAIAADKPFVEKKVVLQISDPSPFKQTLVLNVAGNLVKKYGPDKIDIEIVAFGPGLRLLQEGNVNTGRIDGLVDNGDVRFAACGNTIDKFAKALGHKPELHASATVVPGGVVRIMELIDEGFVLIKP